jgi:hypothetical protein
MKQFIISATTLILMGFALPTFAHQDHDNHNEQVNYSLMVELAYSKGKWIAKPIEVMPCDGPGGVPLTRSDQSSMVQLLDQKGQALYQRYMRNPRWVHFEVTKEGKKPDVFLDEVKLKLVIPIQMPDNRGSDIPMPNRLTFTETVGSSDRASVSVNIGRQLSRLYKASKSKKDFPCQLERVTADHLPPLQSGSMGSELFANSDNVKALLMSQPELALKVIADMGTSPATFRRAIYDVKDQWQSLGIDKRRANQLIQQYNSIYRKKKSG